MSNEAGSDREERKKWIRRGIQAAVWIVIVFGVLVIIQELGARNDCRASFERMSRAKDAAGEIGFPIEDIDGMLQGSYKVVSKDAAGAEYVWRAKLGIKDHRVKLRFGKDGRVKIVDMEN